MTAFCVCTQKAVFCVDLVSAVVLFIAAYLDSNFCLCYTNVSDNTRAICSKMQLLRLEEHVMMKNIAKAEILQLKEQVSYQPGQVVSKTLAQNSAVSVTLFAFDKDEEISTHESGGDAMVTCLDGVGRITIDGEVYLLHEGESIVMPAKHPHAVYGEEQFKMLLVVVF